MYLRVLAEETGEYKDGNGTGVALLARPGVPSYRLGEMVVSLSAQERKRERWEWLTVGVLLEVCKLLWGEL